MGVPQDAKERRQMMMKIIDMVSSTVTLSLRRVVGPGDTCLLTSDNRHAGTITEFEVVVLLFKIILNSSVDPSATELWLKSLGDIGKWANRINQINSLLSITVCLGTGNISQFSLHHLFGSLGNPGRKFVNVGEY
uniref:Uncharacterized protein n=1 Tax=Romanomermis culicivorax TaxID=13658 RepID=A0A915JZE1_ROMCU